MDALTNVLSNLAVELLMGVLAVSPGTPIPTCAGGGQPVLAMPSERWVCLTGEKDANGDLYYVGLLRD